MSKFCSLQLPVCKVIPPSGYGSRKAAWLSSGLMGWFGLFLAAILGLAITFPVRACAPENIPLKEWCQQIGASVYECLGTCSIVQACFGPCPNSVSIDVFKQGCESLGGTFSPESFFTLPTCGWPWTSSQNQKQPPQANSLTANFTTTPTEGEAPLKVKLDASASTPQDAINNYQWIIENLTTATTPNTTIPNGSVGEVNFTRTGDYQITLTVTNAKGETANTQKIVKVTPPALKMLDPACSGSTTCNGNFLQVNKDEQKVVILDSAKDLLNAKVERSGVATDGVTQLLLRMKSEEPIIFTLNEAQKTSTISNCKWGKLMQRDGSQANCGSVTAMPEEVDGEKYVFAAYQSPLNFPLEASTGSMPAKVTIEVRTKVGEEPMDKKELQLEPAPILLIHGVWSSPDTWTTMANLLMVNRFKVFLVDHRTGGVAVSSFDPEDFTANDSPVYKLFSKIVDALVEFRGRGVAATQVDVVAHSMGGLIARALVKSKGAAYEYERLDNYQKGDLHKIITIGTPHQGTRIADVLVNGKCHQIKICTPRIEQKCLSVLGKEICTPEIPKRCYTEPKTLEQILPKSLPFLGSHPLGPAVYGFQTGSTAIKHIGETPVPSHSIVAGAPTAPNEDNVENALNWVLDSSGLKAIGDKENTDENLRTIDDILGGDGQHDVIVPIESQRGGLTGNATTLTNQRMNHLEETSSNEVHNRVLELLRQSPDDLSVFSHFTALQGGKSDLNFKDDQNRCQVTTNTKSSLRDTASDAVISFEPQIGTVVTPGQQVKFLFDIQGGSVQKSVLFTIGDDFYLVKGAPPYTLDYTVPANTGSKINIYALTVSSDPNEEAYAVESYLTVKLPDTATTGTTETVPVGSCGTTNETSYTVPLDRSGFYIIEATLPPDQRPGVWSLLIDSMSRAPLRSKTIGIPYAGGLHGGVVLREKGLSSSWIGFSLAWPESVKIKATDSLKNLSSFKLEVVKQTEKGWASVYGPVDAVSEQVHSTNRLDAGFYAVVVTSKPESPRGQLGISIDGQSLWGAVTGGWIDHTGVSYSAFFVGEPKQTADLKLLFCGSYGAGGAGEPTVQMLYQKADGSREVYWHAK